MIRYSKPSLVFAVALSALAGYVDACGFVSVGYFFSFMSGNSTRLGIALSQERFSQVGTIMGLIVSFVLGVILGTLAGHFVRPNRSAAVLSCVTLLLVASATLHHFRWHTVGYGTTVLAMGAENAVFQAGGEVSIGLTYITGTLVKMGQRLAGALLGESSSAWVPYACLWLGMVIGAAVGGAVGTFTGRRGLWFAAVYAACLTLAALSGQRLTQMRPIPVETAEPDVYVSTKSEGQETEARG